jgi:hypothetical protein
MGRRVATRTDIQLRRAVGNRKSHLRSERHDGYCDSGDESYHGGSRLRLPTPITGGLLVSGGDLGRLDLQKLAGARDRDHPRLHRLGNLAHEVDV